MAIIGCFSSINTKKLIQKSKQMEELGNIMIKRFNRTKNNDDFHDMSLEFAQNMDIITPKMNSVINELHKNKIKCGVALFGETVFTIIHHNIAKKVLAIMNKYQCVIIKSEIDKIGARMI